MPTSGSRRAAASTLSRFIIGSPMPMNTRWSTRLDAAEVQHLVEDLGRGQVAAELHLPGGAERARQRAAGLRGDADRAAAVAVAHQHGLDGAAVVGVEERLDRAVGGVRLAHERRAWRTGPPRPAARAAPPAGRSSRRSRRAPSAAQRQTWRARKAGSPASASVRSSSSRSTASYGGSDHAPRQVPRPRRRRLAARLRELIIADGRVTVDGEVDHRSRPRRRRRRRRQGRRPAGRQTPATTARRLRRSTSPPASSPPRKDPQGRRTVVDARAQRASASTRSAGSTPTRPA